MVPFKNVTGTVTQISQQIFADHTLSNPTRGDSTTGIEGFLDMLTPSEVFATYNVMLNNPAILHVDNSDAPILINDYEFAVTADTGSGAFVGMIFRIKGRPEVRSEGLDLDHSTFLLDQLTYPITS